MRDARRIEDLEDFRKECIKKRISAKPYIVEKTIELSKIDYENYTTDLLADRQFIAYNLDIVFVDNKNVLHCLLIVRKINHNLGVLIEKESKDCPMFLALYRKQLQIKRSEKKVHFAPTYR